MIIGVTGADGLLGTHIRAYLHGVADVEVRSASRRTFEQGELEMFVTDCDVVIHLAGMNRGDDAVVAQTNVDLAQQLIGALNATKSYPHILFSSSTHIEKETSYGESKHKVAGLLAQWAELTGSKFTNMILPGVFGEGGRPYYNSVVSTFCYQLTHGEIPVPHADTPIEQIHAQEVARQMETIIRNGVTGDVRVQGHGLTVYGLLSTLQGMQALYANHIIPDLRDDLRRDLFNTYRSYLYPQHYPVALTLHSDPRGSLFEAVKSPNGGQSFMSTTHPGITRGNHYHTRKVERFLVTGGEAEIKLRHLFGSEVHTFKVSGEQPSYVDIPTLHTHSITNIGIGTLTTFFWTHELFDLAAPDTVAELVEQV